MARDIGGAINIFEDSLGDHSLRPAHGISRYILRSYKWSLAEPFQVRFVGGFWGSFHLDLAQGRPN